MMNKALRIAFAGTPDFAAQHLHALLESNCNIVAVFSQPDRPAGRGKKLKASPVKTLALEHNIPVHQPPSFSSPEQQALLQKMKIDIMVVVAYGLLLPQSILDTPTYGCLNVHASLLPRWRGAAPIERAIMAGDEKSGISIMQMDAGLDTGDVLLSLQTPLNITDNSQVLTSKLIELGRQGLLQILKQIEDKIKPLSPCPQDDSLSLYAGKLKKSEALIKWNRSAVEIQRQINALYPRSPAYCFLNNERIRIIQSQPSEQAFDAQPGSIIESGRDGLIVACLDSSLIISQVQLAGKKANTIANILNGQPKLFTPGIALTPQEISSES